jgi:predicted PurR-regulated permease PerM
VREPAARTIVRIVLIIVAVAVCLYLLYQVRRPLTWLFISMFLAIALSGPVNRLSQHMRRGLAIAIVYIGLLLIPIALMALIVPPFITEGNRFAENVPEYSREVTRFVQDNDRLRELNKDYDITQKLQDEADKLPSRLGGAATTLRDVGIYIVNSVFALITILVLTAFMLGGGRGWVDTALQHRPPEQRVRLERSLNRITGAVGGYVAGALFIAFVAGLATYVMLTILGVPFRAPLAVVAGLFSLIPLVGATIAAVLIGVVTLFENFPTATIVWAIWAIVYQQFENHVIQPQVQRRTVDVHPFVTIVSVLLGSTLLGVLGALLAIPIAASIQILLREYFDPRTLSLRQAPPPPADEPPPPADPPGDPVPA